MLSKYCNVIIEEDPYKSTIHIKAEFQGTINYNSDTKICGIYVPEKWFEEDSDNYNMRVDQEIKMNNIRFRIYKDTIYIHKDTLAYYGIADLETIFPQ